MNRIAHFEKVSLAAYTDCVHKALPDHVMLDIPAMYERIRLPERATAGSAGYDFFSPLGFTLVPGASICVPTGIRVRMDDGWVLLLMPRSGLGTKYRLQINNTVGVIDGDYYDTPAEGPIMTTFTNDTHDGRTLDIAEGEAIMQGIFVPYGITTDDAVTATRVGGFGSTGA